MITVINTRSSVDTRDGIVVYIGRGSILGNPFRMKDDFEQERNQVCNFYREWILTKLEQGDTTIRRELNRLYLIAKRGNLYLRCFCAPKRCHGDVIKSLLNEKLMLS